MNDHKRPFASDGERPEAVIRMDDALIGALIHLYSRDNHLHYFFLGAGGGDFGGAEGR